MKIRHKLISGYLGIALLIWIVGYLALNTSQKALKKSIGNNSIALATQVLDSIDRNIYNKIERLQSLADPSLQKTLAKSNQEFEQLDNIQNYINEKEREWTSVPKEEITPFMKELNNNELSKALRKRGRFYEEKYGFSVFPEVFVTNKYGANIAQTGKTSDYRQDDEEWWQRAEKDGLYVGDVEYDESSATHSVAIGTRIDDEDGNFIGIMKAALNIEEIINIIKKTEATHKHETMGLKLITKDRKTIYSTEEFALFEQIPDKFFLPFRHNNRGKHVEYFIAEEDKSGKGQELFAHSHSEGYKDFKGLGWILIVEHKTEEIFAPVAKLKNILLIISLIVTIFAVLIGLFISRSISIPIIKLKAAAAEIGKGKLDTKIEITSNDEVGQLAASLKKMGEDLKTITTSINNLNKEIAERKRAEQNLKAAKEQAELLYRVVPSAIFTIDKKNRVTSWNNKATEITGYTAQEVLGSTCTTFALTPCMNTSGLYSDDVEKPIVAKECIIKRKDGRTATILKNADLLKDLDGNIIGEIECFEDITNRKEADKALLESEARYRTLYESSRDAIMILGPPEWKFRAANGATIELFGLQSEEELTKKGPWDISPEYQPDGQLSSEKAKAMIEHALKEGSNFFEWQLIKPDGKEFPATVLLARIELEGEQMLQATTRDITESKQAEEAIKTAYEQLKQSNMELKEMQSQLVQNEKLASIGQLAAGVAHEMNTPVGFVAGNFQTLESHLKKILDLLTMQDKLVGKVETSGNPKLRTIVDGIGQFRDDKQIDFILEDIQRLFVDSKEGVDRTIEIIQNLRDFSRIDQPGSRDEYDLNKGIEATLVVARNEIKYDADVKTDLAKLPLIFCHSGQINQVLLNILVNAAYAIKSQERQEKDDRGTITIRTYASDDGVVCEISDNGLGIPPDKISNIFDPFFTTKPVGKGTGLGLSVSYDIIVNKHNGELLVDSTVGEGTKFTINLPISTKENDEEEEKETISNGKENSIICGR